MYTAQATNEVAMPRTWGGATSVPQVCTVDWTSAKASPDSTLPTSTVTIDCVGTQTR